MRKCSRNVGSKRIFVEPQKEKRCCPITCDCSGSHGLSPVPHAPRPKSLSVRSEILLYRSVLWIKYVFFDCAMPLAVGFSASPQAKILLLGVNLSQIHRQAILRTGHPQHSCLLALL